MGLFNNVKTVIMAIVGFLAMIGFWKYKNKSDELEEANSKVNLRDKEKQSLKSELEVKDKFHNQEKSNMKLETAIKESELIFNKKRSEEDKKISDILNSIEDSTDFNLKA